MKLGLIGLGRMGGNIARRLMTHGHEMVVYDRDPKAVAALKGAAPAQSLEDFVSQLPTPRAVWVMLPAGKPTEDTVHALGALMSKGDIDPRRRQQLLQRRYSPCRAAGAERYQLLDVGTSGGVWGLERGYCMMIGGDEGCGTAA